MKQTFLILCICLYFFSDSFSQLTFQKTFGDSLSDQAVAGGITREKGIFMAGDAFGPGSVINFYLAKTDSIGIMLWGKSYGTTGLDYFYAGIQTLDGGFLLAGSTDTTADIYLVKTDSAGNLQWSKSYRGNNYDLARSVRQTADSGYIITGSTNSFGAGNYDCFLMRTDASGNIRWAKTFGSNSVDDGLCVRQTADGGFAIAGETLGNGSGMYDSWFIKTDSAGNIEWNKTYGGSANYEYTFAFIQTADHGYLQAGATGSFGVGDYDGYLVKTDSSGNVEWSKTFGSPASENLNSVSQTMDGGYILSMRSYNFTSGSWNGMVIKTDASGDTLWTRTYGGNDFNQCWDAEQTADSGYAVIRFTNSFGAGADDFYLIKTDSLGNSGCHEKPFQLVVTSPASLVTSPSPSMSVPNFIVATPATIVESRGIEGVQCYNVAIAELPIEKFILYPNPVSHNDCRVTIQMADNASNFDLGIYDICGKQIMHLAMLHGLNHEVRLDVSPGIYFVKLFNKENFFTQKLIVQ